MIEPHPEPKPNRGGSPGTYCMFCGARLVARLVPDGFDPKTGEPRFERRMDCPNAIEETR